MRAPRKLSSDRAFAWYGEAIRLFKRYPFGFAGLTAVVIVAELAINAIPVIGEAAANVLVPLLACSLLFASLATDRDDRPQPKHLIAPFLAPPSALGSIIASSLIVFAVQWMVAKSFGVDLMLSDAGATPNPSLVLAIYGGGIAASLPLTLVPMLALFEGASIYEAFETSLRAFALNVPTFLTYGAMSFALAGVALLTFGIALLIVVPLWAASSYAAWKDLSGVGR